MRGEASRGGTVLLATRCGGRELMEKSWRNFTNRYFEAIVEINDEMIISRDKAGACLLHFQMLHFVTK